MNQSYNAILPPCKNNDFCLQYFSAQQHLQYENGPLVAPLHSQFDKNNYFVAIATYICAFVWYNTLTDTVLTAMHFE